MFYFYILVLVNADIGKLFLDLATPLSDQSLCAVSSAQLFNPLFLICNIILDSHAMWNVSYFKASS